MKIAILTHPLRVNYGGLLQAYALKKILERQGHEVSHLQLKIYQYKYRTLFSQSKALIKYIIHIVKGTPRDIHTFLPLSKKEINFIRKETNSFIKRYLNPQYHTNFTNNLNYKYDHYCPIKVG